MDAKPPRGSWVTRKGALRWDGPKWNQKTGEVGEIGPLQAWMRNLETWGTLVAAKTAELEDRIEKLETELKNIRRAVT